MGGCFRGVVCGWSGVGLELPGLGYPPFYCADAKESRMIEHGMWREGHDCVVIHEVLIECIFLFGKDVNDEI